MEPIQYKHVPHNATSTSYSPTVQNNNDVRRPVNRIFRILSFRLDGNRALTVRDWRSGSGSQEGKNDRRAWLLTGKRRIEEYALEKCREPMPSAIRCHPSHGC